MSADVVFPRPPDKQGSHDNRSQESCKDGEEDENFAWGLPVSCYGAYETAEWLMGSNRAGLLGVTHFWRTQETRRFCHSPEARGNIMALQHCLKRELQRITRAFLFFLFPVQTVSEVNTVWLFSMRAWSCWLSYLELSLCRWIDQANGGYSGFSFTNFLVCTSIHCEIE